MASWIANRAFSAFTDATTKSGESTTNTKRPRYTSASRLLPAASISSIPTTSDNQLTVDVIPRPKMANAETQTDYNLQNSIVVPAAVNKPNSQPPPRPQKTLQLRSSRPAAPPVVLPPKEVQQPIRKVRSSPRLAALPSSVSVSHVGNVIVNDRRLTSFSSICRSETVDVPSRSPQKKERPPLRHTRTAPVEETTSEVKRVGGLKRVASSRNLGFSASDVTSPKLKKEVNFGGVQVFHFHFACSYDTVPSTGPPLGMEYQHFDVNQFDSLSDFQRECALERTTSDTTLMGKNRKRAKRSDSSLLDVDSVNVTSAAGHLKPRDKKARRQIMITQNISVEKDVINECNSITNSRTTSAGCTCRGGVCRPLTCSCAGDQVACQVDKPGFPCSCSASGCGNPQGRKEFDADFVHSHYEDTLKRLKTIERNERELSEIAVTAIAKLQPHLNTPPQSTVLPSTSNSLPRPQLVTPKRTSQLRSSMSIQTPQLTQSLSVSEIPATPSNLLVGSPLNVTRRRFNLNRTTLSATALAIEPISPTTPTKSEINQTVEEVNQIEMEVEETIGDQTLVPDDESMVTQLPVNVFVTSPSLITDPSVEANGLSSRETATLLPTSRSISAATTTTDETSRANSTEIQLGD
ncbi:Cysteine/serine-rich nuclear protein 1-like protein [Aphelenchoides besseyi]|nr:Cysteine/serine-rich nuclear protein 1-like protein [Aphelenchoides besseyi]